jgi:adenosine/AMP kinase|uniref:Adenosine monophosphate-protein transferase n=1 Tax=candidate division WOR-3 bacterium TaxID=2052148 RepID=A0A7V3PT51_UNCW3
MELKTVQIEKPAEANVIVGQSHFIKTVEDIHELLVTSVPGIKFGLAFCEASGPCLVRHSGTDAELETLAISNALALGAGHSFVIILGNAYPVNILNGLKQLQEVCSIFCASANSVKVVIVEDDSGRGILGVIDGQSPKGVEGEKEIQERKEFLRRIGYKQ